MQALTYAQIEEAAKAGPEAVAAMLHGAGVEIAGMPKDLRRKLRGEAPAPTLADLSRAEGETDAERPHTPPAKDPPPPPTTAKRTAP